MNDKIIRDIMHGPGFNYLWIHHGIGYIFQPDGKVFTHLDLETPLAKENAEAIFALLKTTFTKGVQ